MSQQSPEVSGKLADIRAILQKLGMRSEMEQAEQMQAQSSAYHFDPENIAPPKVQKQLLDLLHWRDNVFRVINKTIEVLGLSELFEAWRNAINACKVPCRLSCSSILTRAIRCVYYSCTYITVCAFAFR